jgi:photosystem II stability/assembly factor-like uncharacterized protein
MKRVTLLLLGLFFVAQSFIPVAVAQEYQDWKFMHPRPQANAIRKHKMLDANIWFAVGANGTFMRTTDAGASWYFHHQAGKFSNSAQAIGQNNDVWYLNAATGIVAGDRGYIGRTTNGGTTFDSVANGLIPVAQRANAIWFADANTGYVSAGTASGFNGTIVKTTDGGLNWTSIYTTTATTVQTVTGTDAQTVYAVLADGGVIKTTNGGTTWSTPTPNTVGIFMYNISFLNATTGFVVGSQAGLYRTTNAGTTWDTLPRPQVDWAYYQMKIISPTEIYAVGDPSFLYKSTNLGTTWTSLPIIPLAGGPSETLEWFSLEKQGTVLTLAGTYGIIAKSTDGGNTWSSNHVQLTTQLRFDIQVVPGTRNVVAVGRQSGAGLKSVFRSSNAGDSWTSIDIGVTSDLNALSMVNSQIGYACGTNSQVVKTTNGGLTWAAVTRPHATNYTLQTLEFIDANTGWVGVNFAAVTGGNIFKTTDGGTTWTQQTIGTTDQIVAIDMVDANVGYLCLNSSNRPIYKTTNGGTNWTAVTQPFTGQIRDIRALDASNVYIGAGSGTGTNRVGKSTDGGATWTQIALPITVDVNSLDFKDVNTGYVTGNSTTVVCKTTNAGSTWSFQNVHLPTLVKVYAGPGDTTWALGTTASILRWAGTPPPPAVTRTIGGTAPDFPTIKAAIRDLNAQGVPPGGVTYLIRSGTYNEDSLRIRTSSSNPSAPIMFRPDAGATVVVNVTPPSTAYNFAFSIDTTNAVTISGIPVGGTATDRNLTINALGTNGQVGIRALGNSDNLTVKNVVISCAGSLTSTAVRGVDVRYVSATQIPDSLMVDYVYVKRAGVGIRLEGFVPTNTSIRAWIQNCSIGTGTGDSIGVNGINVSYTLNPVVRNNTIRNIYGTGTVSGIAFGSAAHGAQVYNNSIATVRTTGTGSIVSGLQIIGTQDVSGGKLYNNFISDVAGVATGTGGIYGFYITSGAATAADTLYHNSVNLSGTGTGLRRSAALGLEYFGGTPSVILRNNIFVNTRQEGLGVASFATTIYRSIPLAAINSDYNDLYVSPTPDTTRATAVYFISTNNYSKYATLGDFRFATGLDNNSVVENPSFVSATDLHLNPATPTQLESAGTTTNITTDIDGQARSATTPDIGADEGTFTRVDLAAPVISFTPLPPAPTTGGRVASATITDFSGIPTGASGPRLWHKNSTDPTYTAAPVDSVRGTSYYFTIPGRATGTTVQYYLAAQDLAPTSNVGTWPPGGSGINPPGSTAPSRVFSYLVQAPLAAGSYTIGTLGNFPTLDSAFRKLSVDGIAGAVTFNFIDTGYVAPGKPRKIIKENAPEYEEVNGKREMLTQIYPYEYEQEDAPTISLQTLTGPIIGAGPTSRITFRPAAGTNVRISGSGTYLIRLLDASYVTIDGINTGGSTLTMRNLTGTTLAIEGNSDNNIVQNVSFAGAAGVGGSVITLQNSSAEKAPDLNLLQNNTITKGWVGVAVNPTQSAGYAVGNRITRNTIKYTEADSLNQIGIFFQNASGTLIDNNEISRMRNFITIGTPTGISGQGRHRNTRIWNNVIDDIIHINSFDVSAAYGINITATAGETTKVAVYNNMISGIDDKTVGNGRGSRGISFTQGINDTIAYNTVYLTGSDGWLSTALYNNFTPTSASRVWRNNLAINARVPVGNARTYAFVLDDATSQISSNYNDLYVPQQRNSFIAGGFTTANFDYPTLLDWQTTGRDLNSVSVPVNFRIPALHIDSTIVTSINNAGTPIAGITTDFDGQTRSATTPDIGADEFGGIAITRDIGVATVQEIAPTTAALDNMNGGNREELLSMAADVATNASSSPEIQVDGATIQRATGDGLLFEALADTIRFRALVRNYGTLPETTYQVRWSLDGAVQATVNNPRILLVGRTDTVLFQWNNATPGAHLLKAWTLLAADPNRANDTLSQTIIGPATVPAGIYNNGPVISSRVSVSGVAAPAGFRWSEMQAIGAEANSLLGVNDAQNSFSRFRLADDFIVPTGQTWRIDSLVTYSYQSNDQGFATPYTSANVRIWRGAPDSAGSTVVFGDTLTNRLTTSYNSRVYRISNTTTPAPGTVPEFSRVLYQNTISAGITLVPGRYFIDWQTFTDLNNSHFSPTVTLLNRRGNAAWNARQRATNGVWSNVLDLGNPTTAPDSAQDFPFVLIGSTGAVAAHDIGVASAVQLPTADTVRFRASVWNFGATPETTYQVRWSIDGTVQATINNTRILAVGGIDTVFLNWAMPTPGNHTLRAWTLLGTDANRANDTVTVRFTVSAGWTFNNSGTGNLLNTVKAVNRNIGWAGGNNATVLRTVDGGTTWLSRSTTTISGDVYAIEALNDSLAFVTTTPAGSATRIYRTTNAGTTWTSVFNQAGGFIDAIKMYNATTGIALGDPVTGRWTILKTTNGGAAWTRIATEPIATAGEAGLNNCLATFDTTHIWFGTTNGRVYRSTDAGLTWNVSPTTFTGQVDEVAFNGPLNGVAGGQDAASRTTNGGATWIGINIPGAGFVLGLSATGNDFWAAQGPNVYRSTNLGATWTTSYTGTIGTLRHLDFATVGSVVRGWTVSDIGGIAAALLLPTGVDDGKEKGIPTSFALDQNYPNPFNPTTKIQFALPVNATVSLKIYNLLGQEVATLVDESRQAGYHEMQWNGRNQYGSQVATGVYFYRIEAKPADGASPFTSLKKMILIK